MTHNPDDYYNRLRQQEDVSYFRGKWIKFVTSLNVIGAPKNYSQEEVQAALENKKSYFILK